MKYRLIILSLFFVFSLLTGISFAQNKVVVIPLLSDSGNAIPTVTSANGRVWMDRNLGAVRVAESVDDYHAYGYLYQWGRLADGHEDRGSGTTAVLSAGNVPGHDEFITATEDPYDWSSTQNDDLWPGVSGVNNPCPAGFRLPTETEWETERTSWNSNDDAGAFASPLKLVVAGFCNYSSGAVLYAGSYGVYWSSAVGGSYARNLFFYGGNAEVHDNNRANGFSVRCIKD